MYWPPMCLLLTSAHSFHFHVFWLDHLGVFLRVWQSIFLNSFYRLAIDQKSNWNYFSHSQGSLFTLFIIFFSMQKLFKLMWCYMLILVFLEPLLMSMSSQVFPTLSSRKCCWCYGLILWPVTLLNVFISCKGLLVECFGSSV